MTSEPPRTAALPADRPPGTQCGGTRCEIQLQNPCGYPEAGARRLRPWLEPLVAEVAPSASSLAVRFVSDREMRRLNARYRRRDCVTDVLTFPGELDPSAPPLPAAAGVPAAELGHLGDVVVSVPAARRQARRLGHAVARELRILLLHGVLHCLGHDHETDGGVMSRLEKRLRSRYVDHG